MYRKDIDGLRAIAVLSVITFHINEEWLEGGFLGVDIFFVISGYLISLLLLKEIDSCQSIDLAGFYERRVRRIMPALVAVIAATLISGVILLTPDRLETLFSSALWSAFSLGNIFFYQSISTDYFADDSREIPLLHLWSLGVEEQFYMIWPLLLLAILKFNQSGKWRIAMIVIVLSASLVFAHFSIKSSPSFAYYMLPTRAWELMAGSLASLLVFHQWKLKARFAECLSLLGFITIFYSFDHISKDDPVPGLPIVPAIIGTAALIWTGSFHKTYISRLLAIKPLVAIGLVSYSAYLWHWPILAYIRYATAEIEIASTVGKGVFLLVLLIAYLSYRFIEKPTRQSTINRKQVFFCYLILPVIVISSTSLYIQSSITEKAHWLIDWQHYDDARNTPVADNFIGCGGGKTYEETYDDNPACVYPSPMETSVILVGDSNAEHYLPALRVFADQFGFSFTNRTNSTCPFLLDDKPVTWIYPEYQDSCAQYRKTMAATISRYDTIIIGGSWTSYDKKKQRHEFRQRFSETIEKLSTSHKKIIILGKIPRFSTYNNHCEIRALKLPWLNCETLYDNDQPDHDINGFIRDLTKTYNNVHYFAVRDQLCHNDRCSPYFNGAPAYSDGGHLNQSGAKAIARTMLATDDPSLSIFSTLPSN